MAELDAITATLRRRRKDLEHLLGEATSRSSETAALLGRIEELTIRSGRTQRVFRDQTAECKSQKGK